MAKEDDVYIALIKLVKEKTAETGLLVYSMFKVSGGNIPVFFSPLRNQLHTTEIIPSVSPMWSTVILGPPDFKTTMSPTLICSAILGLLYMWRDILHHQLFDAKPKGDREWAGEVIEQI